MNTIEHKFYYQQKYRNTNFTGADKLNRCAESPIKILREMAKHKIDARKSLYTYLTTGIGEEEVVKQLERSSKLNEILEAKGSKSRKIENSTDFTKKMLRETLSAAPDKDQFFLTRVKDQVRINAIALFNSYIKEPPSYFSCRSFNDMLDSAIYDALNRIVGIEKCKRILSKFIISDNPVPFEYNRSSVTINNNGKTRRISYPTLEKLNLKSKNQNDLLSSFLN